MAGHSICFDRDCRASNQTNLEKRYRECHGRSVILSGSGQEPLNAKCICTTIVLSGIAALDLDSCATERPSWWLI